MSNPSQYIPGVCNIGVKEIQQRKLIGIIGLLATLLIWVLFVSLQLSSHWFLLLFFPATVSAMGFLQAFMRFCFAFGLQGVFNVGSELRQMETVSQAAFRAQDKKKAWQLILSCLLIGIIVAGFAFFIH